MESPLQANLMPLWLNMLIIKVLWIFSCYDAFYKRKKQYNEYGIGWQENQRTSIKIEVAVIVSLAWHMLIDQKIFSLLKTHFLWLFVFYMRPDQTDYITDCINFPLIADLYSIIWHWEHALLPSLLQDTVMVLLGSWYCVTSRNLRLMNLRSLKLALAKRTC